MNDRVNTAIITSIDQYYEENLEFDFLETLFNKAHYSGSVIILDYGMSEEASRRISKRFPVVMYKYEKDFSVFFNRCKHIPEIINSLDENIEQVMVVDGGDVWFQCAIDQMFRETKNKVGIVAENRIVGEDDWTDRGMQNLHDKTREKVLSVLKGKLVANAGVVCGDRNKVAYIYRMVYEDVLESGIEYFGVDQLFLNYEWYQLDETERVYMDCKYNYVMVSHSTDEYIIEDDIVYDAKDRSVITVVHNAGGNWRIIKRPFKNRYVNENQYYIENATSIDKKYR